jgi:hypothetical protein
MPLNLMKRQEEVEKCDDAVIEVVHLGVDVIDCFKHAPLVVIEGMCEQIFSI